MPDEKKPWGDNFDEEKAWTLVQNLRADKAALQTANTTLKAENADLVKERDTAQDEAGTAKKERDADRRAAVLKEFEIDEDDAAEFLPDGLSLDELRRKAERLASRSKKDEGDKSDEGGDKGDEGDKSEGEGQEPTKVPGRPEPKLVPGHGSASEGAEIDLDAIAARRRPSAF